MNETIKRLLDQFDVDGALKFVDAIKERQAKITSLVQIAQRIVVRQVSTESLNWELAQKKKSQWLLSICVSLRELDARDELRQLLKSLLNVYPWAEEMIAPLEQRPTGFEDVVA